MPKVKVTKNRVVVHVGDLWKKYKQGAKMEFRVHDVGRRGKSERIAVKYRGRWYDYAWSFDKEQVKVKGKKLVCYDPKAYEILAYLKKSGDLKGWKVCIRTMLGEACI